MSAAATASQWKSPSHPHSHSRSSRPSTTPRSQISPFSVGQSKPPLLSPNPRSPRASKSRRSPSPSYFGFVVGNEESMPPDSNPGYHARQNWDLPSAHGRSIPPSTVHTSLESCPEYAAFRKQSEQQERFHLSQNMPNASRPSQSRQQSRTDMLKRPAAESPTSPRTARADFSEGKQPQASEQGQIKSFFDIPRHESPSSLSPNPHTASDLRNSRLSLPSHRIQTPPLDLLRKVRAETLPSQPDSTAPAMISAKQLTELLASFPRDVLLLDVRVYPQYAASRVRGALNLCIPTTLLKRPTFTVQKLAETLGNCEADRKRFEGWEEMDYIVVYDASSQQLKEATTSVNVLRKFSTAGWKGHALIVKGGFMSISKVAPELLETTSVEKSSGFTKPGLTISPPGADAVPVAGGCSMPSTKSAANPFFGNIRQNMDLLDGVGQMPVKRPDNITDSIERCLPAWLRTACKASDEGKAVSDRFLNIEKTEQKRMQEALTCHVSYGSPQKEKPRPVQVAGIEKGSKNRYNNILPFDHSRVKLQGVPIGDCDYVNANHVRSSYSNRRYIATQAPIPATMDDFWRVVWEQNVRVIVNLTAEFEGGQVKCHPYWNAGTYGPLKLKRLSEKRVALGQKSAGGSKSTPQLRRPSLGQRSSTNPHTFQERKSAEQVSTTTAAVSPEAPAVTVRHFTLSHSAFPFEPMREITQLQYTQWPDFGAPADPTALIELIDQMNRYVRDSRSPIPGSSGSGTDEDEAAPAGQRPILVHCSAGCGRTGTFCTVDSVIDMLKRQRMERVRRRAAAGSGMEMDVDYEDDWVKRDDIDLVAKAVEDFRMQRLSMVQNLRQFVLCYESVLQWLINKESESDWNERRDRNRDRNRG